VNLQKQISDLEVLRKTKTIGEVMDYVFNKGLLKMPSKIKDFKDRITQENTADENIVKDKNFYDSLMQIKYYEIIKIDEYIEEQTPFSTKHGVKGAEYDNVLVVIDDSSWNQYKFNDVFAHNTSNQQRYDRTKNLLYVCCSRAKNHLALLSLSQMDNTSMNALNSLFGNGIYDVKSL